MDKFDYLSDLQKLKIETFCNDTDMKEAVRMVLLAGLYKHGVLEQGVEHNPLINGAFSLVSLAMTNPIPDAQLGEHLRGMWAGVNALETGFNALERVKLPKDEKVESPYNEAL